MKIVNDYARAYKLLDLIKEKYGEAKFELGIKLTLQWIRFDMPLFTGDQLMKLIFEPEPTNPDQWVFLQIYKPLAESLRQLFGLKTIDQLYNKS